MSQGMIVKVPIRAIECARCGKVYDPKTVHWLWVCCSVNCEYLYMVECHLAEGAKSVTPLPDIEAEYWEFKRHEVRDDK